MSLGIKDNLQDVFLQLMGISTKQQRQQIMNAAKNILRHPV